MPIQAKLAILVMAAFVMNLPLGYLRQGARKYSFSWFLYIHLSIPFIVLIRLSMGVSNWYIPVSLASAVAGQIAGGRYRRKRIGG